MSGLLGPVSPPDLQVMTYNVRRAVRAPWPPADRWQRRQPRLQALLRAERPALLGAQEVLPRQAQAIGAALGPAYRRIGSGRRAGGLGEGCPVYYDSDRLELTSWTQTALSSRPGEPGSRTWGNLLPRVLVQADLRDRSTGARLRMLNTHFDPFSRASRVRSAEHVRLVVAASDVPVIVTGDLNDRAGSQALETLFDEDVLVDAWEHAHERVGSEWGTFGGYREPRAGTGRIDWVAVTPDIEVRRIGINTSRHLGGWASDHLPVQAVVRIPTGAPR